MATIIRRTDKHEQLSFRAQIRRLATSSQSSMIIRTHNFLPVGGKVVEWCFKRGYRWKQRLPLFIPNSLLCSAPAGRSGALISNRHVVAQAPVLLLESGLSHFRPSPCILSGQTAYLFCVPNLLGSSFYSSSVRGCLQRWVHCCDVL